MAGSPQLVIGDGDLSRGLVVFLFVLGRREEELEEGGHSALAQVLHGAVDDGDAENDVGCKGEDLVY